MDDFDSFISIDDLLLADEEPSASEVAVLFDYLGSIVNETERKDFISKLFDVLPTMNG